MVALRCRCAAGVLCLEKGKILLPPPLVLFYHSSFGNCSTQCYCKRLVRKYDYKVGFPKCPWKIFKWMRIPPESWKALHLFTPCELLSFSYTHNCQTKRQCFSTGLGGGTSSPQVPSIPLFLIILTAINQQASVFQPNLILDSNLLSSSAGNKITSIRHPAIFRVN